MTTPSLLYDHVRSRQTSYKVFENITALLTACPGYSNADNEKRQTVRNRFLFYTMAVSVETLLSKITFSGLKYLTYFVWRNLNANFWDYWIISSSLKIKRMYTEHFICPEIFLCCFLMLIEKPRSCVKMNLQFFLFSPNAEPFGDTPFTPTNLLFAIHLISHMRQV